MSWYDYIPIVGSVDAYAHGQGTRGTIDLFTGGSDVGYQGGKLAYDKLYQDPANAKKAALDAASAQAKALGQDVWGKAMQGKNEALAQYAPADAAYQALYGDPATLKKAQAPGAAAPGQPTPGPGSIY